MSTEGSFVKSEPCAVPHVDLIDPQEFNWVFNQLWKFFSQENFLMVPVQHRVSILAACEDPTTVATYNYSGQIWPLPQTGQMWLEYELLTKPEASGYWCYSTSYRQEADPIPGRHNLIFPMIEFETKGGFDQLQKILQKMVSFLGFKEEMPWLEYRDACERYGTQEIHAKEEAFIEKDYGTAIMLGHFPVHTSPFWNMKLSEDGMIAQKIDVILHGIETVGSAERSCDADEMRRQFMSVSNGMYAKTLFAQFGRERVLCELDDFLSLKFFPRCGGGIGVTRLIRALKLHNLLPKF